MRNDGWYLRQDIIWHKPNPMPESVRDRCTKSHEYIFLFSKNKNIFMIMKQSKNPQKIGEQETEQTENTTTKEQDYNHIRGLTKSYPTKNKRSVWSVTNKPYREAHFATYPPDLIEPCILAGVRSETLY